MKSSERYILNLIELLEQLRGNSDQIEAAAVVIAKSLEQDGLIHVFGTGHSHMLAEEMFYRAGGLGAVNPILEEDLMLHISASKSTELERKSGLAEEILARQIIGPNDVFIIASNSGGNAVVTEMALEVKKRGLKLIAITSIAHSTEKLSRISSSKLHEIADVVLDNLGVVGDASIQIENLDTKVGPTSTVIGTAIVNAISVRIVEILTAKKFQPLIFGSSNTQLGEERNAELILTLQSRISFL